MKEEIGTAEERSRKTKVTIKFLGIFGHLLLIAASWFFIQGEMNTVTFLLGAAGMLTGYAALQQAGKPTEFEQRQIAVFKEINAGHPPKGYLLRGLSRMMGNYHGRLVSP